MSLKIQFTIHSFTFKTSLLHKYLNNNLKIKQLIFLPFLRILFKKT